MKQYRFLLLDLDNTILDFDAAEQVAIRKAFRDLGLAPTDALIARYCAINIAQWEAFERGELTRDEVLVRRFALLFDELGLSLDPEHAEALYRGYLGIGHYFIPYAPEVLAALAPHYQLFIASNGVADTQESRLASAGIVPYFEQIFISETTGHHKPERAYFEYCFAHISGFDPAAALMIGDSLTSDILGGIRAGIDTCWFNPKRRPGRADIRPTYEIHALPELLQLLAQNDDHA